MELKLEDLTKDELIRLIRQNWVQPRQHEILFIRWGSLVEQARKASSEGSQALQERDWKRADELFKRSESLWEKANAVFTEGERLLCMKE